MNLEPLEYVLYKSRPSADFESGQISQIVEASARNNPGRGVTGFFVYARDRFLQFVEGPDHALDALLSDLRRDPRHMDLEVLDRGTASRRSFPAWRMERLKIKADHIAPLQEKLALTPVDWKRAEAACALFTG